MTSLKKDIVYTFLAVFVVAAIVGLSGLIGWFDIEKEGVRWLFGLLIAQCATVIVAIIKAPEYFAEPEAIIKLTEEHQKEISELHRQLEQSIKDRENAMLYISSKILPDDPTHPFSQFRNKQDKNL